MNETIEFKLNHKAVRWSGDGRRMLLWVLRSDLGLTGAKSGCGKGVCGACTVLINKKAFRSCQVPIKKIQGKEIVTIEGLGQNGKLHPLQRAFIEHGALQCGFCTPGMILNAYHLLMERPVPTEKDILEGMNDILCRCGAHRRIVQAIQSAAIELRSSR